MTLSLVLPTPAALRAASVGRLATREFGARGPEPGLNARKDDGELRMELSSFCANSLVADCDALRDLDADAWDVWADACWASADALGLVLDVTLF